MTTAARQVQLQIKCRENWRMVAGLFPTAHFAADAAGMSSVGNIWRGPNVI